MSSGRGWRAALFTAAALVASACNNDEAIDWVQFNAAGDTLLVGVGTDGPVGQSSRCDDAEVDPCAGIEGCICLRSSLEAHVVGTAVLDPPFGPVGTIHTLAVEVDESFELIVGRVDVLATGERGEDTVTLRQDSADAGSWRVELESLGASGETRTDSLEVRLYEPDGVFSAEETE